MIQDIITRDHKMVDKGNIQDCSSVLSAYQSEWLITKKRGNKDVKNTTFSGTKKTIVVGGDKKLCDYHINNNNASRIHALITQGMFTINMSFKIAFVHF